MTDNNQSSKMGNGTGCIASSTNADESKKPSPSLSQSPINDVQPQMSVADILNWGDVEMQTNPNQHHSQSSSPKKSIGSTSNRIDASSTLKTPSTLKKTNTCYSKLCNFKLVYRIQALFTVFILITLSLTVIFAFDFNLAVPNHGAHKTVWFYEVPKLQMIFYIGLSAISAEVTVRLSRKSRGIPTDFTYGLSLFMLLVAGLFLAIPQVMHERHLPSVPYELKQTNKCVDLNKDLSATQQSSLAAVCPGFLPFDSAMIMPSNEWNQYANESHSFFGKRLTIGLVNNLAATIADLTLLLPSLLSTYARCCGEVGWGKTSVYGKTFFSSKCIEHFNELGCTVYFDRCSYSSCDAVGGNCTSSHALDRWLQCGMDVCNENNYGAVSNIPVVGDAVEGQIERWTKAYPGKVISVDVDARNKTTYTVEFEDGEIVSKVDDLRKIDTSVKNKCAENINKATLLETLNTLKLEFDVLLAQYNDANELFSETIKQMMRSAMAMAAVRVHEYTARDSLPEKPIPLADQCQDWVDDFGGDLLENTTRTDGCNPKNRLQPSDNIPIYYDGSLVYFCVVFPVLFVFVFVLGDEPHNIKYSTWREGLGRTISLFMGMIAACFICTSGINLERASLLDEFSSESHTGTQIWASFYFITSLLAIRHSLMLLLPLTYVKDTKLAKIAEARRQQKIIRQRDQKEARRRLQRRDSFIRQHSMQNSSKLGKFFGEEPEKRESFSHRMSNKLHEFEQKIEHEAHVLKQKFVALEHELEHEAHVIAHELSDLAHHGAGAVHVEIAIGSSKEDQACRKIQLWWFKMNGSYATRIKQRAKLQLMKDMEEMKKNLSHLDRCRLNTTYPCWYSYKGCCNRNFLKFFVAREIFENFIQLLGLYQISMVSDIDRVLVLASVFSLNLVLLPAVALLAEVTSGPVFAKGVSILLEVLFDKAFVISGVVFRLGVKENLDTPMGVQILRHLPVLLPAVAFAVGKSTPFINIANSFDKRERDRRLRAARCIQQAYRMGASHFKHVTFAITYMKQKTLANSELVLRHQKAARITKIVLVTAGTCSTLCGLFVWFYAALSISNQMNVCEEHFGPITHCMRPRIYFSTWVDHGLFSPTSCSLANVKEINCHANKFKNELYGVTTFKETDKYRLLTNVTGINISSVRNSLITSLPKSWSIIPNLVTIDASHNPQLRTLPFDLCNTNNIDLTSLDLTGTNSGMKLDWSNIQVPSPTENTISQGCAKELNGKLQILSLASNNYTIDDVQRLLVNIGTNISFLNLTKNSVRKVNRELIEFASPIIVNNQTHSTQQNNIDRSRRSRSSYNNGIVLNDCPIDEFFVSNSHVEEVFVWSNIILNSLQIKQSDGSVTYGTTLKKLSISGIVGQLRPVLKLLEVVDSFTYYRIFGAAIDISETTNNPSFTFSKNAEEINLSDSHNDVLQLDKPSTIGANMLKGCTKLKAFVCNDKYIEAIHKDAFKDAQQTLQYLDIKRNNIDNFDFLKFKPYPNLVNLLIGANSYTKSSLLDLLDHQYMPSLKRFRVDFRPNQLFNGTELTAMLAKVSPWLAQLDLYWKDYFDVSKRTGKQLNQDLTGLVLPKNVQTLKMSNTMGNLIVPDGFFTNASSFDSWWVETTANYQNRTRNELIWKQKLGMRNECDPAKKKKGCFVYNTQRPDLY